MKDKKGNKQQETPIIVGNYKKYTKYSGDNGQELPPTPKWYIPENYINHKNSVTSNSNTTPGKTQTSDQSDSSNSNSTEGDFLIFPIDDLDQDYTDISGNDRQNYDDFCNSDN